MACSDSISLLTLLQVWIPDFLLGHFIDQSGWVQRERKIDPVFFVWTLILGWSAGAERSIASLHRTYQRMLGSHCARAAFYRRFTPKLVVVLELLWSHLTSPSHHSHRLGPFADVLALDATIFSLWTALAGRLPAYQKGQAAHKLQLLISLKDYTPNKMMLDAGTGSDHKAWKMVGSWVADKLVLCDLGYYNFWFFHRIQAHGGFFLTRLKKNCALTILDDRSPGPGRRKSIIGLDFSEALEGMQRQLVECIVEVPVSLRSGRQVRYRWRAIAIWNAEQKRYHTYHQLLRSADSARGCLGSLRAQVANRADVQGIEVGRKTPPPAQPEAGNRQSPGARGTALRPALKLAQRGPASRQDARGCGHASLAQGGERMGGRDARRGRLAKTRMEPGRQARPVHQATQRSQCHAGSLDAKLLLCRPFCLSHHVWFDTHLRFWRFEVETFFRIFV